MLKNATIVRTIAAGQKERLTGRVIKVCRDEGESTARAKYKRGKFQTGFSIFVLVVALLGAVAAAGSKKPTFWLLRGPAPLVVIFTVTNFLRQGFHRRDGVLVLGRATKPEASEPTETADGAMDQGTEIKETQERRRRRRRERAEHLVLGAARLPAPVPG